jgi:NAD(P)-dependent dehydrogenase (short-subunit alcohol dehydrogenase family)
MQAIVTGYSRGLGAAIAENLLQRGCAVLGLARQANAELQARFPALLTPVALDLADAQALAAWLGEDTLTRFVANDDKVLLINNAGTVQPVGPPGVQGATAVAQAVSLNVAAPLMLADAFVAATPAAHDRRILHVSSGAARGAYAGWSVYCATKAALDQHARAIAEDGVPALRICSLAPGVIDTDMQLEVRTSPDDRFPSRPRFEALKREGGLASPQACAQRLVAYLLSEAFGNRPVDDLREAPPA